MKGIVSIIMIFLSVGLLHAQTPMYTDGLMMPRKDLGNGLFYGHDQWTRYWEGAMRRENGNVGTVSTQSVTWMGAYGLTEKVSLIATLPYVWTNASGGTLKGMKGLQDFTFAAKYQFASATIGKSAMRFFAMGAFSTPVSNYTPDFLPLSIGLGCRTYSARLTANYTLNETWFATWSGAYTVRSNVYLDRPSYYTNGHIYYTNEVQMPSVFDFIVRAGYNKNAWRGEVFYTQQNTLGGGDIRRQDAPLASNQMNSIRAGASVLYVPPSLKNIGIRAWGNYTLAGRNVGQSTTFTVGAMYFLHFSKNQ